MSKKHEPRHRPGWSSIERYMPDAAPEAKEDAYANLRGLIQVVVEIDNRLMRERQEKERVLQPPLF